jgi:HD superfamily phosphodiesterase
MSAPTGVMKPFRFQAFFRQMNETLIRIFDLARPYLTTRCNEEHTRIAYEFAVLLLREQGGNPDVVLPAIILHDVGWNSVPEELQLNAFGPYQKDTELNRVHEREGARIAREILETVNYPFNRVEEIVAIVLGHDSRHEALSLNDAIVKDSDKLWRYSGHGVMVNAKRFGMTVPHYLDHLRSKSDEWFLTRTAESLARQELESHERSQESEE